jgi:cell division protein FtsI/penicillin-binding protein 2
MKRGAAPQRDSLRGQLMRSDSARFLDRMFCFDKGFAGCARPWDLQSTAQAFGWNTGCDEARADCGKHDLLFGRAIDATAESGSVRPLATPVAYGRVMSGPVGGKLGAPQRLMPRAALDPAIVRRCAFGADGRRLSDDDWEKCRGGSAIDVVAEGWGQGHARSSALGVAGMMATLAAAANGQTEVRRPHLVQSLRGVGAGDAATLRSAVMRWSLAPPQPNPLSRDAAEVILDGLSYGHRAGTSRTACEQVFDAKTCRGMTWIAGKTGTPSFPSDALSLDDLVRLCGTGNAGTRGSHAACGSLRPYKWYVAAYRTDPKRGAWTKVIAVLTERNWLVQSGHVHGAGDHGPNPAAEIAMQIAGRHVGLISGAAP